MTNENQEQKAINELESYIKLPDGVDISKDTAKMALQAIETVAEMNKKGLDYLGEQLGIKPMMIA